MSAQAEATHEPTQGLPKIIFASAAGTMIEWYDFYIFGSLATVIASKFYQTGTSLGDLIAWLATFAIGRHCFRSRRRSNWAQVHFPGNDDPDGLVYLCRWPVAYDRSSRSGSRYHPDHPAHSTRIGAWW
jgi:hypothetical protein